jgi:hypothetical protein
MDPRIFPSIQIALSLAAAVAYGVAGDFRRSVYWAAAAILTTTITY